MYVEQISGTNQVLSIHRLITGNDQNSANITRKYDCLVVEQITRPVRSFRERVAMKHLKKHQISIRRVTLMSHRISDIVAILLYFVSIVQTRPNGGSPVSYWYNPCHHNNNQKYEFTRYSVTKDDMTRIKEQLNTSLGSVEESVKNFAPRKQLAIKVPSRAFDSSKKKEEAAPLLIGFSCSS
ncbi:uncharacterized protein LOC135716564 [Ochlerotatus camptorhynchus]|uniref:uncharacterized protein LOC135716564 n=1 Tax=Ochlerotatus camptorhynchus TaxID=644619 RepID=UPI0031DB0581